MNTTVVNIFNKVKNVGSLNLLKLKKISPELMIGLGVVSFVGTIIVASNAATKAEEVIDEHKAKMDAIKEAKKISEDYTDQDATEDTILIYTQTGKGFLKLYWPTITLGALSIACFLGAHGIMKQRNAAVVAAYGLIEKAFAGYRGRVVEELGKDKDFHFMYDTKYEDVTVEETDANGKTKKVKKQIQVIDKDPDGNSMYARYFSQQIFDPETGDYVGSSQWSPQAEYNAFTLVIKNQWANEHLKANGFLFLNDVYEELGFPKTKAGQVVGWYWQGDGDNYVSFGSEVDAIINKTAGYLAYRDGSAILLDFNVDGVILDKIK